MIPAASLPLERLFSDALERVLLAYEGSWVAIVGDEVVAAGDTPTAVVQGAAELGHTDVLLHFVLDGHEAYIF